MPYVEVWVEPEEDRKQTAAMRAIIMVCRDILAARILPPHDAETLDKAVGDLLKEWPVVDDKEPGCHADVQYKKWLASRVSEGAPAS